MRRLTFNSNVELNTKPASSKLDWLVVLLLQIYNHARAAGVSRAYVIVIMKFIINSIFLPRTVLLKLELEEEKTRTVLLL